MVYFLYAHAVLPNNTPHSLDELSLIPAQYIHKLQINWWVFVSCKQIQ